MRRAKKRYAVRLGMRLVKGLANDHAAKIVAARQDRPFASVDDLWRRAGVPVAALVCLAEAMAFCRRFALPDAKHSGPSRPCGMSLCRFLPLPPLGKTPFIEELQEPSVALRAMTDGGEVVQDYGHVGLTLREHPMTFLRRDLSSRRIVTCAEAYRSRDGARGWKQRAWCWCASVRFGKGRDLYDAGGRDGHCQCGAMGENLRKVPRVVLTGSMVAFTARFSAKARLCIWSPTADRSFGRTGERRGAKSCFSAAPWRGDEFHRGISHLDRRDLKNVLRRIWKNMKERKSA